MNENNQEELLERQRLVQTIKNLPPAPFILNKILECIEDPKTCAADLKEVILQDSYLKKLENYKPPLQKTLM